MQTKLNTAVRSSAAFLQEFCRMKFCWPWITVGFCYSYFTRSIYSCSKTSGTVVVFTITWCQRKHVVYSDVLVRQPDMLVTAWLCLEDGYVFNRHKDKCYSRLW